MKKLIDGKMAKEIDNYSIHEVGIPSLVLMERAALSVVRHVMASADKRDRFLAVCGVGNNGADALAAIRILYLEGYVNVSVLYVGNKEKASEEWNTQANILENMKIPLVAYEAQSILEWQQPQGKYSDWIFDGIFGIGLSREVRGVYKTAIEEINRIQAIVVAIDIASGIDSNTGAIFGSAVRAKETITFGFVKTGCMLRPGAEYSGSISCYSIGFVQPYENEKNSLCVLEEGDIQEKLRSRPRWGHKGTFGKVLVIAGSKGMAGAAYFSAAAAYAMGAGLVRIFTVEENRAILQTLIPEAVLTTYFPAQIDEEQVREVLTWADAAVIGPGLGVSKNAEKLLQLCLQNITVPFVLDADGLNMLAVNQTQFEEIDTQWKFPKNRAILTPHMGEMTRLMQTDMKELQSNLVYYASKLAKQWEATVVEKDWRSLICDADGSRYINVTGTQGMGVGGSGDVLSGVLGALLAYPRQEQTLAEIAAVGVWIHGMAGECAAHRKGERSMTARDLIEGISEICRKWSN